MKLIDLTHTFERTMPVFPGMDAPVVERVFNIKEHHCNVTKLDILTHMGTHLDCSSHVIEDGFFTSNKDINFFFGEGKVIDCSHLGKGDEIGVDVLDGINTENADFIFLYTGWDKNWNTNTYSEGFPVVSRELAEKLGSMNIKGVGLDVVSLDKIEEAELSNHQVFLSKGKIIVENLTNLNELVNREFKFIGLPLKIQEGDGSPIRAAALVE